MIHALVNYRIYDTYEKGQRGWGGVMYWVTTVIVKLGIRHHETLYAVT